MADDGYLPEGFSETSPQQPQLATWQNQLDSLLYKSPLQKPQEPAAKQPQSDDVFGSYNDPRPDLPSARSQVEPEPQKAGGWQGMLQELIGVKPAEAKTKPKPGTAEPPGAPPIGTKREDGKVYVG